MSVPIIIDSDAFALLFSRPVHLAVSVSPSEEVQRLRDKCAHLEAENARLGHAYACSSALLGKFRDFCRVQGVSLPRDLLISTPWG